LRSTCSTSQVRSKKSSQSIAETARILVIALPTDTWSAA
jgi:hypothetical protein